MDKTKFELPQKDASQAAHDEWLTQQTPDSMKLLAKNLKALALSKGVSAESSSTPGLSPKPDDRSLPLPFTERDLEEAKNLGWM